MPRFVQGVEVNKEIPVNAEIKMSVPINYW